MRRRTFVSAGVSTATATLLLHGLARSAENGRLEVTSPTGAPLTLRRTTFKSWIGTSFLLRPAGALRSIRATLVAVKQGPDASGLEQFQLLFQSTHVSPRGLCTVRHESGATFQLHVDSAKENGPTKFSRATFCLIAQNQGLGARA